MKRLLPLALLITALCTGQDRNFPAPFWWGSALPALCVVGDFYILNTTGDTYTCPAVNTWVVARGVAAGQITFILSGSCPIGFSEATELNGLTVIGTTVANGDVGTTGGSNSLTPAGTISAPTFTGSALGTHTHTFTGNALGVHLHGVGGFAASAPIFTGSALATHAHELPFIKLAGGTGALRMLASSIFGTGTSRAPESTSANPTANTTSAAVELSQAVSAGTPSGTNSAPILSGSSGIQSGGTPVGTNSSNSAGTPAGTVSAPTFTGNSADSRSAFIKVIFCKKI